MISIQHYRMSIGTFTSRNCSHREPTHNNKSDKRYSLLCIFLLSLLMTNLFVATYVHSNRGHKSHKQQNKLVHITNGNRNCKGYKLSQWNCGSAFLENKMVEIEAAVARIKPTVFCVSESNLRDTVDQSEVQIPGYRLLTSQMLLNPSLKISR